MCAWTFPRSRFQRGYRARAARVARPLTQGKGRESALELGNVIIRLRHKKAPDDAGAFELLELSRRSVLRDHRAAPVEAVDQFAADGVDELLRVDRSAGQRASSNSPDRIGPDIILREAVLGLPEQAGQEVQRIFVAGTQEPTFIGSLVKEKKRRCSRKGEAGEINLVK